MTIRLVLCNDSHFVAKNPVSRVDDYNEEVFAALDQVAAVARHVKAAGVCHAGDWFHKSTKAPWPLMNRLLRWGAALRNDGIKIFTIPGNHDLDYDRYESADKLPVGVLFESGIFTNVSREVVWVGGLGTPAICGVPWPDGCTALEPTVIPGHVSVVLMHGWATPEGTPQYGNFCHQYDALAKAAPHVKLWHFGHDHSDHGVWRAMNHAMFVNIGALARGALDLDTLNRQVKIAIATFPPNGGDVEVQQVALKLKPVDQVFDLKLRAKKRQEAAEIEAFVAQLQGGIGKLMSVDYQSILQGLPLEDAVRSKVQQYIAAAESV